MQMSRWLTRSETVSVDVEKSGGLFFHPMGNTRGKVIIGSVPVLVGNTTPSLGTSLVFRST